MLSLRERQQLTFDLWLLSRPQMKWDSFVKDVNRLATADFLAQVARCVVSADHGDGAYYGAPLRAWAVRALDDGLI